MIKKPANVDYAELPTSTAWFDENGIFCSVAKKVEKPSLEELKIAMEKFKQRLDGKKICMLVDVTNTPGLPREIKDYMAEEFPKITKAIALVSDSALGKMLANLFFTLRRQPYPTKMFSNEEDAKTWLKQYL